MVGLGPGRVKTLFDFSHDLLRQSPGLRRAVRCPPTGQIRAVVDVGQFCQPGDAPAARQVGQGIGEGVLARPANLTKWIDPRPAAAESG